MNPSHLIQIPETEPLAPAAIEVARCLEGGGIVALPTDTVYGLCCRADDGAAVDRLYGLKGRSPDKPLPYLIPDPESLRGLVQSLPASAQRLRDRSWPGPLTLVVGPDPGVAVRVPDHEFLRMVLRAVPALVFGTSANHSGDPALVTSQDVEATFADRVDLIVAGGPKARGTESTLARVLPDGAVRVLRSGSLSQEALDAAAAVTVLFICTGNTCRSPMAEAVLRDRLRSFEGYRVLSAGVSAPEGAPMTEDAQEALEEAGIPWEPHAARRWTPHLAADHIWAMTASHLDALMAHGGPKARLLDPSGADVPDPFGCGPQVYAECLNRLEMLIEQRLPEILAST